MLVRGSNSGTRKRRGNEPRKNYTNKDLFRVLSWFKLRDKTLLGYNRPVPHPRLNEYCVRNPTLGRYEIRSKPGEGGTGEVYLVRDTQLDRDVVLKILTAKVARDQERRHRFCRRHERRRRWPIREC